MKGNKLFAFFVFCALIFNGTSCVKKINEEHVNEEQKQHDIIQLLSYKIENGVLTYEDVFEMDYNEYNEKNADNKYVFDVLMKKLREHVECDNDKCKTKLYIDNIILNSIDKFSDRILDKSNMKYYVYSIDGERWFKSDEYIKAPLNYFQQQFLLFAKTDTLIKLTINIVNKIAFGDKKYDVNFGTFWILYGKENKLQEGFRILTNKVEKIKSKFKQGQKLSTNEINFLETVVLVKKINNIKTDNFFEQIAKKTLIAKVKKIVDISETILLKTKKDNLKK